jgi:hypothetical protein
LIWKRGGIKLQKTNKSNQYSEDIVHRVERSISHGVKYLGSWQSNHNFEITPRKWHCLDGFNLHVL